MDKETALKEISNEYSVLKQDILDYNAKLGEQSLHTIMPSIGELHHRKRELDAQFDSIDREGV